ncbi:MAG: precorrin-6A reductase [Coriobacteriia bacterium]|nr:precorrin-6A reductase [Coriobacteriia bacterium]
MKAFIFGGTTEGRLLADALVDAGHQAVLSVATDFGLEVARTKLQSSQGTTDLTVRSGRLSQDDIIGILAQGDYDYTIDATHPYAVLVTENIRAACLATGTPYIRLVREPGQATDAVTYLPDMPAVVSMLAKSDKRALLTIGSKDLDAFTLLPRFAERLYVRILPMAESLEKTLRLGFRGSQVICMQGPFDFEMNVAMLKMTKADCLVTKDSGDLGGFEDKVEAALSLGLEVIVAARPVQEEGLSLDEVLQLFDAHLLDSADAAAQAGPESAADPASPVAQGASVQGASVPGASFFPLFIDIADKPVLFVGGGQIAERRIKALARFSPQITVIAPKASDYIARQAAAGGLRLVEREYQAGDVGACQPLFVVAATNDRETNRLVGEEAKANGLFVSVADRREECSFYYPALAQSETMIAGLVSNNGDHKLVSEKITKIREELLK